MTRSQVGDGRKATWLGLHYIIIKRNYSTTVRRCCAGRTRGSAPPFPFTLAYRLHDAVGGHKHKTRAQIITALTIFLHLHIHTHTKHIHLHTHTLSIYLHPHMCAISTYYIHAIAISFLGFFFVVWFFMCLGFCAVVS